MEILYPTSSQIFRCEWIGIGLLRIACSPKKSYDKTWRCLVYNVDGMRQPGQAYSTKMNAFAVRFAIGPTIMTPSYTSLLEEMSRHSILELYSIQPSNLDLLIVINHNGKSTRQLMENVLPKFAWGWKR